MKWWYGPIDGGGGVTEAYEREIKSWIGHPAWECLAQTERLLVFRLKIKHTKIKFFIRDDLIKK